MAGGIWLLAKWTSSDEFRIPKFKIYCYFRGLSLFSNKLKAIYPFLLPTTISALLLGRINFYGRVLGKKLLLQLLACLLLFEEGNDLLLKPMRFRENVADDNVCREPFAIYDRYLLKFSETSWCMSQTLNCRLFEGIFILAGIKRAFQNYYSFITNSYIMQCGDVDFKISIGISGFFSSAQLNV